MTDVITNSGLKHLFDKWKNNEQLPDDWKQTSKIYLAIKKRQVIGLEKELIKAKQQLKEAENICIWMGVFDE